MVSINLTIRHRLIALYFSSFFDINFLYCFYCYFFFVLIVLPNQTSKSSYPNVLGTNYKVISYFSLNFPGGNKISNSICGVMRIEWGIFISSRVRKPNLKKISIYNSVATPGCNSLSLNWSVVHFICRVIPVLLQMSEMILTFFPWHLPKVFRNRTKPGT